MKRSEFINGMIKDFFIIFGSIIIIITILRQFFYPDMAFDLNSIYLIMIFSLIGALTGFIFYNSDDISEKNMRIRIVIHFVALEIIMISLASIIGIVNSAASIVSLALEVAVIYTIVRLLSWQNDKRVASEINDKLMKFKKDN